jgi:anti-sigma factor RsiW
MNEECKHILQLLPYYTAGVGTKGSRALVQRHVDICPSCAEELRALQQTAGLLNSVEPESAPDQWDAIRSRLTVRESGSNARRTLAWLGRHRLQSVAATAAAALVIAGVLLTGPRQPTPEAEAQSYFANHASMSWREPFADKAGLGLAAGLPVEVRTEEIP